MYSKSDPFHPEGKVAHVQCATPLIKVQGTPQKEACALSRMIGGQSASYGAFVIVF